ncbi:unnamed protein product [Sphagnum jensenii]|uniref:Collagen-like protein n=1 Tax=Sphagnum jensenii TaxID=128206 RepID=A0ABP1A3L0_9BRYO
MKSVAPLYNIGTFVPSTNTLVINNQQHYVGGGQLQQVLVSEGPTKPAVWTNWIGPIGAQGCVGAQGSIGAQGSMGTQGSQGVQGSTGFQGAQGSVGSAGAQGATGPQGAQGSTGPQGAQGSTGTQGTTGTQGAQGAPGATGAQGATGTQGPQGSTGAQGASGSQGPQGSAASTGSAGPAGSTGAQGPSGTGLSTFTPSVVSRVLLCSGTLTNFSNNTSSGISNDTATAYFTHYNRIYVTAQNYWLQYTAGTQPAGTYMIVYYPIPDPSAGIYTLSEVTSGQTLDANIDMYCTSESYSPYPVWHHSFVTLSASGSMLLRWTNVGKNTGSGGYFLGLAYGLEIIRLH